MRALPAFQWIGAAGVLASILGAHAADRLGDASRLPASAATADYARDIQPIFEKSCFRCHGPEKPKSHFRLDYREGALKGGDDGVDVIPGDSARSPLIHFAARLVPDLEMPPDGKGDPLTPAQVALLRAWIDQGANYGAAGAGAGFDLSLAPTAGFVWVQGSRQKFRELEWQPDGWNGGASAFTLKETLGPSTVISADGRFLREDYRLRLAVESADRGFVRAGFEEFRKYEDDRGGYYSLFQPSTFASGRDLHLDTGRAWIDLGLTLPGWPEVVLGYEFQFREGTKSTLEWGPVGQFVNGAVVTKNLYPAVKSIQENTHILKFDLSREVAGWALAESARVEFYDLRTDRTDLKGYTLGPDGWINVKEGARHTAGMNTLTAGKQVTDWLYLSSGYLYSRLEGDASLSMSTVDTLGSPVAGKFWYSDPILLKREMQSGSVNGMFTPLDGLFLSLGLQGEWSRQDGLGRVNLDEGDPTFVAPFALEPVQVESSITKSRLLENASIRFSRIPFTILFAEVRMSQEDLGQFEDLSGSAKDGFLRDTDALNLQRDFRAGFSISPWSRVSMQASYRRRECDTDYSHRRDFSGLALSLPGAGYSAFVTEREIRGDEVEAKLVFKPAAWVRTSFNYHMNAIDYRTVTEAGPGAPIPGGGVAAGNYDSHVYSVNAVLTPLARLTWSSTFSYTQTRTGTALGQNSPVAPYRVNLSTLMSSASWALNDSTDVQFSHLYSLADYPGSNAVDAAPLGFDFVRQSFSAGLTRRWTQSLSTGLRYSFYDYFEPHAGGVSDFTAHAVFASLTYRWK